MKKCRKCERLLSVEQFRKNGKYVRNNCKDCCSVYKKSYRLANREKLITQQNEYDARPEVVARRKKRYQENKQEILAYAKNWVQNNRKRVRTYAKRRREENPHIKVSGNLRNRVCSLIKGHKSHTTEALLGCTFNELKDYLGLKFQDGMSWDNYGLYGWHVDHIVPCSSFDLTDTLEQMACFHHTNLQPLWAEDNLKKGNSTKALLPQARKRQLEHPIKVRGKICHGRVARQRR